MNGLLFAGLMFIAALRPQPAAVQPAAVQPAPLEQTQIYSTTVLSNIPATLGCVWGSYVCDVQCSSCTQATCSSDTAYSTVGTCVAVASGEVQSWNVVGSPSITKLTEGGWYQALWSGYTYQGDQFVSYQITLVGSEDPDDWTFPTEPLLPYQYSEPDDSATIEAPITAAKLWEIARVALTSYNIVSGGNGTTWLLFATILLLPIGGIIVYRLLTAPPEI